jgi:predicted nucleotidyltransferase
VNDAIRRTIADIAALLEREGVSFALIGGLAVALRGEPQFKVGVDLVIGVDVDRALALLDSARGSPFLPLAGGVEELVRSAFILPLRHRDTGVKVDLALGLTGFELELLHRAPTMAVGGVSLPVATAEDLLLLEIIAERPRDIERAKGIVERQGAAFDWTYVLHMAEQLEEALGQDLMPQLRGLRARTSAE